MDDETQTPGTDAPAAADTATTQPSEADVQTNSTTPEATQETKDPVEKAEDTVSEKLYAGKYKTVDDLENAYKNAESKLGQTTSEKAELARILNDAFLPAEEAPTTTATQDDYYQEDAAPATSQDTVVQRDLAVLKFMMAHGDADANNMKEVLAKDPLVKQISGYEAKLEYAYLRSQNMTSPKAIAEAQKQAANDAQVKIVEKQAAQVETAKGQALPADDNQELSPSQLRDALRDDKSFDELIQKRFPGVSKMRTQR